MDCPLKSTSPDVGSCSRRASLPVVVFSGYDSFREDPRLSQADGYVIKSRDFSRLKRTVAGLVMKDAGLDEGTGVTCPPEIGFVQAL